MVSLYLERPIRPLKQALEDRARIRGESLELESGTPTGLAVGRYDSMKAMIRLLATDRDAAADIPPQRAAAGPLSWPIR